MNSRKKILYITKNYHSTANPHCINSKRRIKALNRLNYMVKVFNNPKYLSFDELRKLFSSARESQYLNIRIDGDTSLDKFTLLKFVNPKIKIIWEVHGFPEEQLTINPPSKLLYIKVFMSNVFRKILSLLVNRYVFISKSLYIFSKSKLLNHQYHIIPNFIEPANGSFRHKKLTINKKKSVHYWIMWAGNGMIKWQALDLIEKVAKRIYNIDKSIRIMIISTKRWHKFRWNKNIILEKTLMPNKLNVVLSGADICLAIYHKNKYFPLYFNPLKIINYMLLKKPIIATCGNGIQEIIIDKKNGLITNNHIEDIVRKIIMLKKSPKLSLKLGNNAYKDICIKYNIHTAIINYNKLFTGF